MVGQISWWYKCHVQLLVAQMSLSFYRWHKCHFLTIGGTNVTFLVIGGTNVDLTEGGTNVRWDL